MKPFKNIASIVPINIPASKSIVTVIKKVAKIIIMLARGEYPKHCVWGDTRDKLNA